MRKEFLAVLAVVLLIPIIFVSGCIEGGSINLADFKFGQAGEQKTAPRDVLRIKDISLIPNPPISASPESGKSTFELSFLVENIGTAEEGDKPAKETKVSIYDWGICTPIDEDGNEIPKKEIIKPRDKIYPGGSVMISQDFKTPTNEELGNMEGKCPVRFKVNYNYDAHSTITFTLVSKDRLEQAARTGESLSVSPTTTKSRGPIKIDLSVDADQPIKSTNIVPVSIVVEDVGTGMYREVKEDKLKLTFPEKFEVSCYPKYKESTGSGWMGEPSDVGDSLEVFNKGNITLIKGKTPKIRCDLRYKGDLENMKTFSIRADMMDYTYSLYGETYVDVEPTYQPLS